jgi:hypothetical protein
MTEKRNGYVTWGNFLTVLALAITILGVLNSFVWLQHWRSMEQFEKRMDSEFVNVKGRLDKIDKKLEK